MIKKHAITLLALVAGLAPVIGHGRQIGEPAPPLVVKEWIKGQPVEIRAGTNIFAVEIFATASSASRDTITNLNELQRRFKDQGLVVVGISDEPADKIKAFMAQEGAAIQYAIAADDRRQTSVGYMRPVLQRGVPRVFLVGKDGKLLWHGHPLDGLEEVVDQIAAGHYNPEPAARRDVARRQIDQYATLARSNDKRTKTAGRKFLINWTNDVMPLCELALVIATDRTLKSRDLQLATEVLDRAEKLAPTNSTLVAVTRGEFLFQTGRKEDGLACAKAAFASAQGAKDKARAEACLRGMEASLEAARKQIERYLILARRNDPQAKAAGRKLLEKWTNDGPQLCDLALQILINPQTASRDLALAGDALNQAERLGLTNSTLVAVPRAILLFDTGKEQEGLARAKEAVAAAQGQKDKARAEACVENMLVLIEAARTNQIKTNQIEKPVAKP